MKRRSTPIGKPQKIILGFGPMALPIKEQLAGQFLRLSRQEAKVLQEAADAISVLDVLGIIPESVARNARRKLVNSIAGLVVPVKTSKK